MPRSGEDGTTEPEYYGGTAACAQRQEAAEALARR